MLRVIPPLLQGSGKRQFRRLPMDGSRRVRVTVSTDTGPAGFAPLNLSLGGLAVHDPDRKVAVGVPLDLEIDLSGTVLLLRATAVHRDANDRVGVRFRQDPSLEAAWMQLMTFLQGYLGEVTHVA